MARYVKGVEFIPIESCRSFNCTHSNVMVVLALNSALFRVCTPWMRGELFSLMGGTSGHKAEAPKSFGWTKQRMFSTSWLAELWTRKILWSLQALPHSHPLWFKFKVMFVSLLLLAWSMPFHFCPEYVKYNLFWHWSRPIKPQLRSFSVKFDLPWGELAYKFKYTWNKLQRYIRFPLYFLSMASITQANEHV